MIVYILFPGLFGSAVDDKGANKPNEQSQLIWRMIKRGPVFCSLAKTFSREVIL